MRRGELEAARERQIQCVEASKALRKGHLDPTECRLSPQGTAAAIALTWPSHSADHEFYAGIEVAWSEPSSAQWLTLRQDEAGPGKGEPSGTACKRWSPSGVHLSLLLDKRLCSCPT